MQERDNLVKFTHRFIVRTPLNAIIGMVDMTLNTELDPMQREYLTSVQNAADSLLRIVNDVMDIKYVQSNRALSTKFDIYSQIESGKAVAASELFNILEVVGDTVSLFKATIERKGLSFEFLQDSHIPPVVMGDPLKLKQIVSFAYFRTFLEV